jgi:hypothetical protein
MHKRKNNETEGSRSVCFSAIYIHFSLKIFEARLKNRLLPSITIDVWQLLIVNMNDQRRAIPFQRTIPAILELARLTPFEERGYCSLSRPDVHVDSFMV